MSGLEESAIVVAGLALGATLFRTLVAKLQNKLQKMSIFKNAGKAVKVAEYIYGELKDAGIEISELPVVDEILEKIESIKNSELGSKAQKSKVISRLLKRLEGEVSDAMLEMVDEKKRQDKEAADLAAKQEMIARLIQSSQQGSSESSKQLDVSQLALEVAKSFTPPQDQEDFEKSKILARVQSGLRNQRRRR